MTTLSFQVEDAEAQAIQAWADELGVDRSVLLREALRRQLAWLASELEAKVSTAQPLSAKERALAEAADWGPAEDWSAWADTAR